MADYIYLLENRLSLAQQQALGSIRNVARSHDFTVFLTGGAVRDLTGGGSVRDLDVTVQGDASKLKQELETAGGVYVGEHADAQAVYFTFPGGVRAEIGSAVSVTYPQPGKPEYAPASISDDLRRRDFTANAMALSLNEGSYGLLMDPLNGTADIENRELRLVSNYGFIEDPSRLIRATRLISRLGWQMEERTRARYETAKEEDYISALSAWSRGYETEEIFYEEDPLRVMRSLEAEGWLKLLSPVLDPAKVNTAAMDELRERQGQLQTQSIVAPIAALAFPLLMAKLPAKDVDTLKSGFARPGFVREIEGLEAETRQMQTRFVSKEAGTPSQVWKMLHAADPTLVLSLAYGSKTAAVQSRLKTFLTDSPSAKQRIPYALLQEMRITPDLPAWGELLDKLFFELMDNRLQTTEEMKAFLSPYSPPAPPPPMNLRRAKPKKEARPSRAKGKKAAAGAEAALTVAEQEEQVAVEHGLLQPGELSGTDQGTSPSVPEELAGKVAPLGKAETAMVDNLQDEPQPEARSKKPGKVAEAAAEAPALPAKAGPPPKKEAARLTPHPIAAREIAAKPAPRLPVTEAARPGAKGNAAPPMVKDKKATPEKKAVFKEARPAPKKTPATVAPVIPARKASSPAAKKAPVAKKVIEAKKAPAAKKPQLVATKASAKKAPAKRLVALRLPAKPNPASAKSTAKPANRKLQKPAADKPSAKSSSVSKTAVPGKRR